MAKNKVKMPVKTKKIDKIGNKRSTQGVNDGIKNKIIKQEINDEYSITGESQADRTDGQIKSGVKRERRQVQQDVEIEEDTTSESVIVAVKTEVEVEENNMIAVHSNSPETRTMNEDEDMMRLQSEIKIEDDTTSPEAETAVTEEVKKKYNTIAINNSLRPQIISELEVPLQLEVEKKDAISKLFSGYKELFRKFPPKKQAKLEMDLANLFLKAEMEHLDELFVNVPASCLEE